MLSRIDIHYYAATTIFLLAVVEIKKHKKICVSDLFSVWILHLKEMLSGRAFFLQLAFLSV